MTTGFIVMGFAFGAILGSAIANRWDWRAIFWFLSTGSGKCLVESFLPNARNKKRTSW